MKRTIITLTLVVALGIFGAQAFAYGPGSGAGCWGGNAANVENPEQYQQFLDQTTDLRRELALDHAELATIMHADNPDAARVRALTERVLDTQEAINEQAETLGIADGWTCPYGGYGNMGGYGGRGSMMGRNW